MLRGAGAISRKKAPGRVTDDDPHRDFALELVEHAPERVRADPATDRFGLPGAPEPEDAADIDVSREVDIHGQAPTEAEAPLPVVSTREALDALDNALIASADARV